MTQWRHEQSELFHIPAQGILYCLRTRGLWRSHQSPAWINELSLSLRKLA